MPYRLTYKVTISWFGPGESMMSGIKSVIPGQEKGGAQSIDIANTPGGQNITGTGTSGAIAAADITTLTNAVAADLSAQMNAQPLLGNLQGWATGGV